MELIPLSLISERIQISRLSQVQQIDGSDEVAVEDEEHLSKNIIDRVLDFNLLHGVGNHLSVVLGSRLVAEDYIGPLALEDAPDELLWVQSLQQVIHIITYTRSWR